MLCDWIDKDYVNNKHSLFSEFVVFCLAGRTDTVRFTGIVYRPIDGKFREDHRHHSYRRLARRGRRHSDAAHTGKVLHGAVSANCQENSE